MSMYPSLRQFKNTSAITPTFEVLVQGLSCDDHGHTASTPVHAQFTRALGAQ
jgi:hypothetical protein